MSRRRTLLVLPLAVALVAVLAWILTPDAPPPEPISEPPAPVVEAPAPPPARTVIATVPLVEPTTRELTMNGQSWRFLERRFEPELPLPTYASPAERAGGESPEEVMAGLLSAMGAGDWRWALSLFDYDGRAQVLQLAGASRDEYLRLWREEFRDHRWSLTRRIDVDGYVILYKRRADRTESPIPHAFVQDAQGRWWLTHDLRRHPVYGYDGPRVRGRADVQIVAN